MATATLPIPTNPVMLSVVTLDGDGNLVPRANLMADATQVSSLLDPNANPVREHTLRSLKLAFHIPSSTPMFLRKSSSSAPAIVAAA